MPDEIESQETIEDIQTSGESTETNSYSMMDAFDEAGGSKETEQTEQSAEENKTAEKPTEETKQPDQPAKETKQPVEATKTADDEAAKSSVAAIDFYNRIQNDPAFQKQVYEALHKYHGPKETIETQKTSDQQAQEDLINSFDSDTKDSVMALVKSVVDPLQQELAAMKQSGMDKEVAQAQSKMKQEVDKFVDDNKKLVDKYQPQMIDTLKKYPDLQKYGPPILDMMLKSFAVEDIVSERVAEEVEKALNKGKIVSDNVRRFSASKNTATTSHPSSSKGKESYSMMDAFNEAIESRKTVI